MLRLVISLIVVVVLYGRVHGSDSTRVVEMSMRCFTLADSDPKAAIALGREALALSRAVPHAQAEAQVRNHIGYCYMRLSLFDSARAEYDASIALFDRLKDPCGGTGPLFNKGLNHQMMQQNDSALSCILRVLEIEKDCDDVGRRSTRLYTLGTVYEGMTQYADALPYYREALALDSARGDSGRMIREHIAVANINSALEHFPSATYHYQRAVDLSNATGDRLMEGYILFNLAELDQRSGKLDDAVAKARRCVALFDELQRPAEIAHASLMLGALLLQAEQGEEAEEVLLRSFSIADSLGIRGDRSNAMYHLAFAREAQGDARGAMAWMKRYVADMDSLNRKERDERMAEMTTRFETEKKEQELALSQADSARQRNLKLVYLISAGALALLLILSISRYRLKRRTAEELTRTNAEVVKQKERAEESERAKDRFLANVSHEIRTPLNAIMGFTGLLLHEHRDERTTRFLSNIREAGDNLLVVINDVLDISRIEAGRLQLVQETFDLHRTVRLCAEILQHRAGEQGNRLRALVGTGTPQWVMGDSARLLQIMLNLTGNALKFTENGFVEVTVEDVPEGIRLIVKDSGIGIPPEKLATVFERFTQVDVNDQRKYGGAGLGLAIVKELVDLHEGTIGVRSEVGRGTVFTAVLPIRETEAPASRVSSVALAPSGSLAARTILVAEDNELNALVTMETLRRYFPGAKHELVHTGRAALERLEQDIDGDIGLVLMDVQMPEMDGMSATRRIRALDGENARVPIIALTASVLPNDLSRCLDAGMDACVPKPFKAEELLRAIGELTGDHGQPQGVGYDVHDPQVALFHWLIPPRLKALRVALSSNDLDEVRQLVHTMRPQLVVRDAQRYASLCDRILGEDAEPNKEDVNALVTAIDTELA